MTKATDWNAALYDRKLSYVSDSLGSDMFAFLNPKAGETILDVGCGTGDLARRIQQAGARAIGIDASPAMIESAKRKYPSIDFRVERAEAFTLEEPVDTIFSNAALHWVKDARGAAACMYRAVKPGGRLIVEFGGKGNVGAIQSAIHRELEARYGFSGTEAQSRSPWYFPSVGEYASLLESEGWDVEFAVLFSRPTPLDGENGMDAWLAMFTDTYFDGVTEDADDIKAARDSIRERLRKELYYDGQWQADYRRIRIAAFKR